MSKYKIWIIFFSPQAWRLMSGKQWGSLVVSSSRHWPGLQKGSEMSMWPQVFFHLCLSFIDQGFEINAFQAATCYNQHNKFWLQRISPLVRTSSKGNSINKKKNSHTFLRGGIFFLLLCPKAWLIILKVERTMYFFSAKWRSYPMVWRIEHHLSQFLSYLSGPEVQLFFFFQLMVASFLGAIQFIWIT